MRKNTVILGMISFFTLALFSLASAEDSVTITTYYPSPYGSYNELTTSSNTYLATTSGNVGVGTTSPSHKFEVQGGEIYASNSGNAITGRSTGGIGVYGDTDAAFGAGIGVYGRNTSSGSGVAGTSVSGRGVSGVSGSGRGVYGMSVSEYSGYFEGGSGVKIVGNLEVTGTITPSGVPSGYCIFPAPGTTGCPAGYTQQTIPLLSHAHSYTWYGSPSCTDSRCYVGGTTSAGSSGPQFMCCKS